MEEDTLYQKVTLPYTDAAPKAGETPFFLVLLLLIFIPPAAWYVMGKEKSYHHWFAYLIGFYSLLAIFGSLIIRQVFQPQVTNLYQSLHITEPSVTPFAYLNVYITLGIIELILAIVIFFIRKKYTVFPKLWLLLSIGILACNSVIQPLSLLYFTYVSLHSVYQQNRMPIVESITPSPTVVVSADQTANWKTYTNTQLGYSFQYPDSLKFVENKVNYSKYPVVNLYPSIPCPSSVEFSNCDKNYSIYITVTDNPKNLSIEDYLDPNKDLSYKINLKSIMINGVEGKRTSDIPGEYSNDHVYIRDNNRIIDIDLMTLAKLSNATVLFNQILPTFHFTSDSVSSISPTCRPRPSCLDATPKCLIAETADMCPAPAK